MEALPMPDTAPTAALSTRLAGRSARRLPAPRAAVAAALLAALATPLHAQSGAPAAAPAPAASAPGEATYADLVTLADAARVVVRAAVTGQAVVPPERAPGLAPGHVRLYVEARTTALLAGAGGLPATLRYLVDLPTDAKGRAPKLKKADVLLFARPVAGRPGELQLVAPSAQLAWSAPLEARLRPVIAALLAADAPPRITGVRDVLSSEGNLAGESETQIFLQAAGDRPAALTVIRRPGMAPRWGVSWGELIDQSARPAERETLAWARLACALPPALPASANLGDDPETRARAAADYRLVIDALGPCTRAVTTR